MGQRCQYPVASNGVMWLALEIRYTLKITFFVMFYPALLTSIAETNPAQSPSLTGYIPAQLSASADIGMEQSCQVVGPLPSPSPSPRMYA